MSALSFPSQPQARAYAFGSVYKGAPNYNEAILPGAVVKGPAFALSAPALGSVVKGRYLTKDDNGIPMLGRMPPPSPLNLHPLKRSQSLHRPCPNLPNNLRHHLH
jgi:hypothetical protein